MKRDLISAFCFLILTTGSSALAQTFDSSAIRAAGALCGAGLSIEVQGELDARINRLFGGIESNGDASIDLGQATSLLESFDSNQRGEAFKTYTGCVIQAVSAMSGVAVAANAEAGDDSPISIDNLLIPAPLASIQNGQRFKLSDGETRAILTDDLVFSVAIANYNSLAYTVSDFSAGTTNGTWLKHNQLIKLNEKCSILPYEVNQGEGVEDVNASFLLKCK